jgi:hypothetical protein
VEGRTVSKDILYCCCYSLPNDYQQLGDKTFSFDTRGGHDFHIHRAIVNYRLRVSNHKSINSQPPFFPPKDHQLIIIFVCIAHKYVFVVVYFDVFIRMTSTRSSKNKIRFSNDFTN